MGNLKKGGKIQALTVSQAVMILTVGLMTLLLDQVTKRWMVYLGETWNIGTNLIFSVVHNPGVFLGAGSQLSTLLRNVSLVTTAAFIVFIFGVIQYLLPLPVVLLRTGMTFILFGILGNVLDRIFLGYVIDFISFQFGTFRSPIFNLADFFQLVGELLVVAGVVRESGKLWPDLELRGRLWINSTYQMRYVLVLVFVGVTFALIAGVYSYTFLKISSNSDDRQTLTYFMMGFLSIVGVFLSSLVWLGIRLSHEVAGPVFAFKRFMREWLQGSQQRLCLRKSDCFKEELESLADELQEYQPVKKEIFSKSA